MKLGLLPKCMFTCYFLGKRNKIMYAIKGLVIPSLRSEAVSKKGKPNAVATKI